MKDKLYAATEEKMKKSIEALRRELGGVRTGRATASLLDNVKVEYYGSLVPVNQVASVATPEPRLLTIQPWDKTQLHAIVKAIQKSDLGLNPTDDGGLIRVLIPALTEERRKDLVRHTKKYAEEGRVGVRNIRREALADLQKHEKAGEIPEDDARRMHDEIQKLTDRYTGLIDEMLAKKDAEIMEV
jgi:ribosome recycling factor